MSLEELISDEWVTVIEQEERGRGRYVDEEEIETDGGREPVEVDPDDLELVLELARASVDDDMALAGNDPSRVEEWSAYVPEEAYNAIERCRGALEAADQTAATDGGTVRCDRCETPHANLADALQCCGDELEEGSP